jgi:hypothetical protein
MMNKIQKALKQALDSLPPMEFSVACVAKSGVYSIQVPVSCTGLESEVNNPYLLARLHQKVTEATYKSLDPDVYDHELTKARMSRHMKAWCGSIIWWNFADRLDKEGQDKSPWSVFYRKWRDDYDYSHDVSRQELKDALLSLGVEYAVTIPGKECFPVKIKIERGE